VDNRGEEEKGKGKGVMLDVLPLEIIPSDNFNVVWRRES
jgi:hypothetical protein